MVRRVLGFIIPAAHLIRGPAELPALHLSALSGFHHDGRQPLGQLGETLMGFWKDLEHKVKNTWGYIIITPRFQMQAGASAIGKSAK